MRQALGSQRVFLGWDGPLLPLAVRWLCTWAHERHQADDEHAASRVLRLDDLLVVVPVARAGRRLTELLAQSLEDEHAGPWTPPQIVTPGSLPEQLYEPRFPLVSQAVAVLCRYRLLEQAEPEALRALLGIPAASAAGDTGGTAYGRPTLMGLAEDLANVSAALSAEGLSLENAMERSSTMDGFLDGPRWQAIATWQRAYEQALANEGLSDPHIERLAALREHRIGSDRKVVLVGTNDLPGVVRQMLEILHQQGVADPAVTALIPAPKSEAASFDGLGNIVTSAWNERTTPIRNTSLRVVDRPTDQAQEVLWSLGPARTHLQGQDRDSDTRSAQAAARVTIGSTHPADQITIGLGDEQCGPLIQRTLTMAGVPARLATGRPMNHSSPMTLLAALRRFATHRGLADFVHLIRHADVQRFARDNADDLADAQWIGLLDRYATEHLQGRHTEAWLGDPSTRARLAATYDTVASLVTDALDMRSDVTHGMASNHQGDSVQSLHAWIPPLLRVLQRVYANHELDRQRSSDLELIDALQAISKLLADLHAMPDALCPKTTFGEAIHIVHALGGGQLLAPHGGEGGVELLGWLELGLDDGPRLVVTGFNEGCVPQSGGADALMPDRLRRHLGLADDQRRYARDMFLLHVIVHSRPDAVFISCRRDGQGEPLKPSRLALAVEGQDLVERVATFYEVDDQNHSRAPGAASRPAVIALPAGHRNGLLPIEPERSEATLTRLPVTAFRDYLACPYRFYLKHVLRLRPVMSAGREMDAAAFGALAHTVLAWFGRSTLIDCADPDALATALNAELDRQALDLFGTCPLPAVRLQMEQMRERFHAFARHQAEQLTAGWRIVTKYSEVDAHATLVVDGQPFTIKGRIDRIDRHPELGYRVVDYKTSDSGHSPEATHRRGPRDAKQWIDLQLPLYRHLAGALGIDGHIELGYILLPKKTCETGFVGVDWNNEALDTADAEAHRVIRCVRDGIYWPPGDPPAGGFDDGLGPLCFDQDARRAAAIESVTASMKSGTPACEGGRR